jgi:hypothetical protein
MEEIFKLIEEAHHANLDVDLQEQVAGLICCYKDSSVLSSDAADLEAYIQCVLCTYVPIDRPAEGSGGSDADRHRRKVPR